MLKIVGFEEVYRSPLIQLWQDCGLTVPWNNPSRDIDRKLLIDPDLLLVGIIKNKVVASVMGGYEGHRGWINYLAVSPAEQRKGYAKLIMQDIESRLKNKGCPKINLQVRHSNDSVIKFYESIGFKEDLVLSMGKRVENDN